VTRLLYFGRGIVMQQVADTHSACNPAVQRTPASNLDDPQQTWRYRCKRIDD